MSTPNLGAGYLKDGGRVCRRCFARIVKVEPSFGLRSRKDHSTATIRGLLHPAPARSGSAAGEGPVAPDKDRPEDPVPICLAALQTGRNKSGALEAARQARRLWWVVDVSEKEYRMEELLAMLELRSFILASAAAVFVWNGEFNTADRIQPEFIHREALWNGERREAVELYLIHLIFQEQWERLEAIFSDQAFCSAFLDYHDLFMSVRDPHHAFRSPQDAFLATVNKVNTYCVQIGRKRLI